MKKNKRNRGVAAQPPAPEAEAIAFGCQSEDEIAYYLLAKYHDWAYQFTDDSRVWAAADKQAEKMGEIAKRIDPEVVATIQAEFNPFLREQQAAPEPAPVAVAAPPVLRSARLLQLDEQRRAAAPVLLRSHRLLLRDKGQAV